MNNPSGRLDQGLVRLAELLCKGHVEPRVGGVRLWDNGLGAIVEAAVADSAIPKEPISVVDLARHAGILGRRRRGGRE